LSLPRETYAMNRNPPASITPASSLLGKSDPSALSAGTKSNQNRSSLQQVITPELIFGPVEFWGGIFLYTSLFGAIASASPTQYLPSLARLQAEPAGHRSQLGMAQECTFSGGRKGHRVISRHTRRGRA